MADLTNVLGQILGDISLFARRPSQWGTIPDVIAERQLAVQQPQVRQSLIGSPFRAGLLGVGGKTDGGQFQPDIPQQPTQGVLQPVISTEGKPIGGLFIDPTSGRYYHGGQTLPDIIQQAKDMGLDTSGFQLSGVRAGGLEFQRRPGPVPPPPAGMVPTSARYDEKAGQWVPTAKTPGAEGAEKAMSPEQWQALGIDPASIPGGGAPTPAGGQTTTTLPTRTNNPGSIKASPVTSRFPGVVGTTPATDGGSFLQFDTPEHGMAAIPALLTGPGYRNLTIDKAMHRWSNGGYGAEAVRGMDPNRPVSSLTPQELQYVAHSIAQREGFQARGQPQPALIPAAATVPATQPAGTPSQIGQPAGGRALKSYEDWLKEHPGSSINIGPGGGRGVHIAAPPAPRTEMQKFFDQYPNATMADWTAYVTARQGNVAGARAEATALVKEKYKTFPAQAQQTLASIYAIRGLATEMKAALQDPEIAANRGALEGRIRNALYNWGIPQAEGENVYQTLEREMRAMGVRPYLAGGRGAMRWIGQLQAFMPAPGDRGPILDVKLDQIVQRSNELEKDVRMAAKERVNPEMGAPGPEPRQEGPAPAPGGTDWDAVRRGLGMRR